MEKILLEHCPQLKDVQAFQDVADVTIRFCSSLKSIRCLDKADRLAVKKRFSHELDGFGEMKNPITIWG